MVNGFAANGWTLPAISDKPKTNDRQQKYFGKKTKRLYFRIVMITMKHTKRIKKPL